MKGLKILGILAVLLLTLIMMMIPTTAQSFKFPYAYSADIVQIMDINGVILEIYSPITQMSYKNLQSALQDLKDLGVVNIHICNIVEFTSCGIDFWTADCV